MKKFFYSLFIIILLFFSSCDYQNHNATNTTYEEISLSENILEKSAKKEDIQYDKSYYTKDDVILYLKKFNKLPKNYITKKEAYNRGWKPREGNLKDIDQELIIGGDRFLNREKKLPSDKYYECDVNYMGGRRNSERLIFNYKDKIYYTNDHYNSFERVK